MPQPTVRQGNRRRSSESSQAMRDHRREAEHGHGAQAGISSSGAGRRGASGRMQARRAGGGLGIAGAGHGRDHGDAPAPGREHPATCGSSMPPMAISGAGPPGATTLASVSRPRAS